MFYIVKLFQANALVLGALCKTCNRLLCLEGHLVLTACAGKELSWHLENHSLQFLKGLLKEQKLTVYLPLSPLQKILFTKKDIIAVLLLLK